MGHKKLPNQVIEVTPAEIIALVAAADNPNQIIGVKTQYGTLMNLNWWSVAGETATFRLRKRAVNGVHPTYILRGYTIPAQLNSGE